MSISDLFSFSNASREREKADFSRSQFEKDQAVADIFTVQPLQSE